MDLSPREVAPVKPRSRRRWPAYAVLALALIGGAVVVTKFLTDAVDYFCNADEIDVKADCSGGKRLRVQGTVERGSLKTEVEGADLAFEIAFNGVRVPVTYTGKQPGGIFKECIPVVISGRMEGGTFRGDQIQVKHSNEYVAENGKRVTDASAAPCPVAG